MLYLSVKWMIIIHLRCNLSLGKLLAFPVGINEMLQV